MLKPTKISLVRTLKDPDYAKRFSPDECQSISCAVSGCTVIGERAFQEVGGIDGEGGESEEGADDFTDWEDYYYTAEYEALMSSIIFGDPPVDDEIDWEEYAEYYYDFYINE